MQKDKTKIDLVRMFGGKPNAKIDKSYLNALGYLGKLPKKDKNPHEYRIFMLGGSTVMSGKPSLPQLVEVQFKKNGYKNIRVFNFGSISSESSQDVIRLFYELYDLEPDLIIMYEGGNDIMDRYFGDPRPGYPYNFMIYEKNPLLSVNRTKEYPLLSVIALRSILLRSLAEKSIRKNILNLAEMRKRAGFLSEEWKKEILEILFLNIKRANILSKTIDSDFMAILHPLHCTKKP